MSQIGKRNMRDIIWVIENMKKAQKTPGIYNGPQLGFLPYLKLNKGFK